MKRTTALTLDSRVKAATDQVSCGLEEEVVILSLQNGEYYGLNPVAATVWELVQEGRTVAEVRDRLLEAYEGVEADECTAELLRLVGEMAELELVRVE